MKTIRKIMLTATCATALFGLMFLFSRCTKTNTVTTPGTNTTTTVTVTGKNDTVNRAVCSISGLITYPNYNQTMVNAPGTILQLYAGVLAGNPLATAYADNSGNYQFVHLTPGTYYINAQYNTVNQNAKSPINGTNFAATYSLVIGSSSMTQNIALETETMDTGKLNISINPADTFPTQAASGVQFVNVEGHSNVAFQVEFTDSNAVGMTLSGTFGTTDQSAPTGFVVKSFRFNQSNPKLDHFMAYVLNRRVNTGYAARDTGWALGQSCCETNFWGRDTFRVGTGYAQLCPETDTSYYWANAGQVSTYGSGYLAQGTFAPVWKASGTVPMPPRVTLPRKDTSMGYTGQMGWDKRIQGPVDMYFEYQGAKKVLSGSSFTWYFEFAAQMVFYRNNFYMVAGLGNAVTVNVNLQITGIKNQNYMMLTKKPTQIRGGAVAVTPNKSVKNVTTQLKGAVKK